MSTIKIKAPAMPEPALFTHELLGYRKDSQDGYSLQPDGVHLGTSQRGLCEQAHTEGETSDVVNEWYSADQLAARDAQWQEKYELLLDELRDAATSLETISRSAGKRWVLDDAGNHVENYLQHPDQIRGYAASRAAVARSALSAITEE